MRHDRFGEPIEDDVSADEVPLESTVAVPHECDRGFEDRNADPPLKPCLVCKPHLAPEVLHVKAFGPERDDDPLNTRRNLETS